MLVAVLKHIAWSMISKVSSPLKGKGYWYHWSCNFISGVEQRTAVLTISYIHRFSTAFQQLSKTFPIVATSSTFQLWQNLQPLLKWNPFSSVTFGIKPHPKCPQSVCPWQFHCCWLTVICFLIESANSPASVFDKNKPPHGSSFSWAQKISLGKEAIILICSSIKEDRFEIVSYFWSQGISENIYRFSSAAFSLLAVLYGWVGTTPFNQTIQQPC